MPDTTPETKPATGDTPDDAAAVAAKAAADKAAADEAALGDAGKKALDTERAARKVAEKARDAALAAVQAHEDATKTEAEKMADRLTVAEAGAARTARLEVALAKRLPAELVDRLKGSTPEELAADADVLLALVKAPEGATPPATPPPGSLDGGARPPATTKTVDEQIVEASTKGDWDRVGVLNAQKLNDLHAKA